jgi:RNA polymerase sigma factor (sigma-70 family)
MTAFDYPIFKKPNYRRRITHEEEIQLAKIIQSNPPKSDAACTARNRMVRANMGLLVATARNYYYLNRPLVDRIQDGSLGLIRAAEKFNPEKGVRFSTYARRWIRQAVRRGAIADHGNIYLPEHIHLLIRRVDMAQQVICASGEPLTIAAIAQYAELEDEQVVDLLSLKRRTLSFEEPIPGTDELRLGEKIGDDGEWVSRHDDTDLSQQATAMLQTLRPEQREILNLIYIEGKTRREITAQTGIKDGTIASRRGRGLETLKSKLTLNI